MLVFGCTGSGWCAAHALGSAASAMASSPFLRIAPTLHLRRCCRRFWSEEPKEEGATNGWTRRRSTIAAQRSPDVVEMEYADLNLKNFYGAAPNLGHIRIRQHVNPLSSSFATPAEIPVWKEVFRDPSLPLMLDIGSGSGRFLLWLAKNCPERRNYLGLEIRQKLVERSQFWAEELGLANIHFMFANATVSFEPLVSTYPGPLMLVSILVSFIQISFPILESNKEIVLDTANSQAICHYFEVRQCPDPYFKKRHHKRRVVQASLVDSISKRLSIRGQVWLV
ncbi:Putative methyltransferase [Musa troglodytarum]|uniref:tRNA (guanine(46)-N(7))-methyltransferase n=1 Tax=Musa troglodytarum TaxID=320322 RepID=A0A9E7G6Q8_9LILI|nr:Putative methyltransferase [Musa troglodytarum]